MHPWIKNTLSGVFVMSLGALSTLIFTNNLGVVKSEVHIQQVGKFHEGVITELRSVRSEIKEIRKGGNKRDIVLATISADLKYIKIANK